MFLHHELMTLIRRVRAIVEGYTATMRATREAQAMSGKGKGRGKSIGEGVVVYKDAAPKTGTKMTEQRIARHFRSLTRSKKRGAAG